MITITNGRDILKVTPGAFKDIFKAQGFHEISDHVNSWAKTPAETPEDLGDNFPGGEPKNTTEAIFAQETDLDTVQDENSLSRKEQLAEIPLNEMTPNQLKEYAKLLDVDIRGLKSKSAVKDKIRSVL